MPVALAMPASKEYFNKFAGKQVNSEDVKEIFVTFDTNRDGRLDGKELRELLACLATSGVFKSTEVEKIFNYLDKDKDGAISKEDFASNGKQFLNVVLAGRSAFIIVDVQNDFISGSLALKACPAKEDGAEVVPIINQIVQQLGASFTAIVYSLDWHPPDHISFVDNVSKRRFSSSSKVQKATEANVNDTVVLETKAYGPVEQRLWPRHCVQNSPGSELHSELMLPPQPIKIYKGTDSDIDSYSAFWDNGKRKQTDLYSKLSSLNVQDVYVCGLATDVCVGATAAHSLEHGFRTALVIDASRGVMLNDIEQTKANLLQKSGIVINSQQMQQLMQKRERPAAWVVAAVDCVMRL